MSKKSKLGSNPLDWIKDTREDIIEDTIDDIVENKYEEPLTTEPQRRKRRTVANLGRPSKIKLEGDDFTKKTTYYIKNSNIKKLKMLGVELEKDLSFLVNQAIEIYLKKHNK